MNAFKKKLKEAQTKASDFAFEKPKDQSSSAAPAATTTNTTTAAASAPAPAPAAATTDAPPAEASRDLPTTSTTAVETTPAAPETTTTTTTSGADPTLADPSEPGADPSLTETTPAAPAAAAAPANQITDPNDPNFIPPGCKDAGEIEEVTGNGTIKRKHADGSISTMTPDRRTVIVYVDGSQKIISSSGHESYFTPTVAKEDYVDKALGTGLRSLGINLSREHTEKISDKGRGLFEKKTGKKLSSKISN